MSTHENELLLLVAMVKVGKYDQVEKLGEIAKTNSTCPELATLASAERSGQGHESLF